MNRRPSQPPKARWLYWARNVSLRRVTTSARLIPQIDGLRFVAIFLVLVDHVLNQGRPFMHPGDVLAEIGQRSVGVHGVDLSSRRGDFTIARRTATGIGRTSFPRVVDYRSALGCRFPAVFTITTDACRGFMAAGGELSDGP